MAEDDDSGVDTNAMIRTNLIPGHYCAQVRHYHHASGVGSDSIKVRRV
ncbi:hypothetical protein [Hydrogenophaga palleronii]|nr:hypothetical protein [Hydrogenophaga palleronii]